MTRTRSKTIWPGVRNCWLRVVCLGVDRHPPQRQRADNAVCLPAPDGGIVQRSNQTVSAGGSSGHPTGDRARRRDTAVQAIQVAGAETTVLNQLRQVNERRRQMMVQDKLLTAIQFYVSEYGEHRHRFDFAADVAVDAGGCCVSHGGDFALFVYYL